MEWILIILLVGAILYIYLMKSKQQELKIKESLNNSEEINLQKEKEVRQESLLQQKLDEQTSELILLQAQYYDLKRLLDSATKDVQGH